MFTPTHLDKLAVTIRERACLILDNLLAQKKIQPMVVVMPNGYAYGWDSGVAADKQQADFEKRVTVGYFSQSVGEMGRRIEGDACRRQERSRLTASAAQQGAQAGL